MCDAPEHLAGRLVNVLDDAALNGPQAAQAFDDRDRNCQVL